MRRVVEIGPSKVLGTMAQKTWKKKLSARDALTSTERTFLSFADDSSKIYYEYEEGAAPEPVPTQEETVAAPTPASAPVVAAAPAPVVAAAGPAAPVEDIPLSALDVVIALSAQKLKKAFDELPLDKSLRDLCAGKKLNSPLACLVSLTDMNCRKIDPPK